ncbi:MAG: hypothetical protein IPN17_28295 [Deltaproteobacteria bacterium]|nr:hypothetical protein [Deltaproteobacteria bacterium]
MLQKKADEGGDALATAQGLQEKITGLLADVAMLQGQLTAAQAVPAAEPTEESIPAAVADALVARRLALVTDARKVLGPDVKLDGLSADAIRRLAVEKALPDQKARLDAKDAKGQPSMHPAELLGLFTGVVSASRNDGLARAHRAFVAPDTRTDGDEDPQATAAAATTTRWQKPLSMSATKGS